MNEVPPDAWTRLVVELAAAAGLGGGQATDVVLAAACDLLGAGGAALVQWGEGSGRVLAYAGTSPGGPSALALPQRPAEGGGWNRWTPIASIALDPRHDLVVTRAGGPSFGEAEIRVLRALAALLSLAGPGAGGLRHVMAGFAIRVVSSLRLEDVFQSAAEAVSRLLQAEIAGVLLPHEDAGELAMRCVVGNTELATARLRVAYGEGLAGRVFLSGRPERVDDYGTDPRSAPALWALSDIEGTCSALAVPMRRDGRVVGVLAGWRRRRAPFTDADEALLQSLADIAAAAVHNASVHSELVERVSAQDVELADLRERDRQTARTLEIQADLARIATEGPTGIGADLAAVVRAVGSRLGASAAVTTDDGRVVAWDAPGEDLGSRLAEWIASRPATVPAGDVVTVRAGGGWLLVAPLRAVGMTFGHLALGLAAPPTPGDRLAAQQAAVASALLIAREEATLSAARRAQSEFVWDLLDGRLPDDVEAAVRARHLGTGFRLPARVVALEATGGSAELPALAAEDQRERARSRLARLLVSHLDARGLRHAVLASRGDLFAVIVPEGELRELAAALDSVVWPAGVQAVAGIGGRVEHVRGLQQGWREAQLARSAATARSTTAFEDLGVLQFLLAPTTRSDLEAFARRRIGPLLDYDADHGTELVPTLVAYFAAECSTRAAAERMFVHHRTVSYRLNRVAELTGMRMNMQEDRLEVQLALKILTLSADPSA